jgi:hypothetical protein
LQVNAGINKSAHLEQHQNPPQNDQGFPQVLARHLAQANRSGKASAAPQKPSSDRTNPLHRKFSPNAMYSQLVSSFTAAPSMIAGNLHSTGKTQLASHQTKFRE